MGRNTLLAVAGRLLTFLTVWVVAIGCSSSGSSSEKLPTFDGNAAFGWLQAQCDLGPRVPNTEPHRAAAEMFQRHLDSLGFKVEMQRFDVPDPYSSDILHLVNIVAHLNPGRAPRLMFAAHWDCRPRAEHDPDPSKREQPIAGADDGASGTAVLLQLATQLAALNIDQGVDLVFFDGEDWGKPSDLNNYLLGSQEFAKHVDASLYKYAVLLDMVGDKNQRFPKEGFSVRYHPKLVDAVWKRAGELGFGDVFVDYVSGPIHDDHISLLTAGIPAIDIIDFDYQFWHTTADTPDKCSAESLQRVGQLLLSLIVEPI